MDRVLPDLQQDRADSDEFGPLREAVRTAERLARDWQYEVDRRLRTLPPREGPLQEFFCWIRGGDSPRLSAEVDLWHARKNLTASRKGIIVASHRLQAAITETAETAAGTDSGGAADPQAPDPEGVAVRPRDLSDPRLVQLRAELNQLRAEGERIEQALVMATALAHSAAALVRAFDDVATGRGSLEPVIGGIPMGLAIELRRALQDLPRQIALVDNARESVGTEMNLDGVVSDQRLARRHPWFLQTESRSASEIAEDWGIETWNERVHALYNDIAQKRKTLLHRFDIVGQRMRHLESEHGRLQGA